MCVSLVTVKLTHCRISEELMKFSGQCVIISEECLTPDLQMERLR